MRTAALLSTVLFLIGCTDAAEPADPGRLVVTGADGEVTLVDPESGERQELAGESLHTGPVQPTASRDGEVVVWTAATEDGAAVARVHDGGGEERDIEVPAFPFFYSFDSGSTTVAALGNDPDGEGVALILLDLADDTSRLVDAGGAYYLDWHPSEPTLAVHVGFEEVAVLAEEGERTPIPVRPAAFQAPGWTDDGRLVASVRSEGATASLGPIAQEGVEQITPVLSHPSLTGAVIWEGGDFRSCSTTSQEGVEQFAPVVGSPFCEQERPSGEPATLAVVQQPPQATTDELAVIDLADGSYEPLVAVEEMVMFDVADNRVAYVDGATGPLRVVDLEGADPVEVSDAEVVTIEWSPGGDLLLFMVFEEDTGLVPHVWDGEEVEEFPAFQPTGVFVTQYLPFWSQYARTITQWAPDGSAFAYADAADEEATVWIQPREGERHDVGPGVMVTWAP